MNLLQPEWDRPPSTPSQSGEVSTTTKRPTTTRHTTTTIRTTLSTHRTTHKTTTTRTTTTTTTSENTEDNNIPSSECSDGQDFIPDKECHKVCCTLRQKPVHSRLGLSS